MGRPENRQFVYSKSLFHMLPESPDGKREVGAAGQRVVQLAQAQGRTEIKCQAMPRLHNGLNGIDSALPRQGLGEIQNLHCESVIHAHHP